MVIITITIITIVIIVTSLMFSGGGLKGNIGKERVKMFNWLNKSVS